MKKIDVYRRILRASGFEDIEVIIDEWGASTNGFWNREECPQLMLREDSRYAAYFGKLIKSMVFSNLNVSKLMICLSGQHEMVTDFSGFRGFFTLNFFKKPIYNAYVLMAKLFENITVSRTDHEGLEVLSTTDNNGKASILLSYSSEYFDKDMPQIRDTVTVSGLNGSKKITVWCIDEEHTNPYTRMTRAGMKEDALSCADIKTLQEESDLKPVAQYSICADGTVHIPVSFTNNALVLIQAE
jgi:hypothetical protein